MRLFLFLESHRFRVLRSVDTPSMVSDPPLRVEHVLFNFLTSECLHVFFNTDAPFIQALVLLPHQLQSVYTERYLLLQIACREELVESERGRVPEPEVQNVHHSFHKFIVIFAI